MANQRYDVLSPRKFKTREGEEKTAWTNVGTAFDAKAGDGFDVTLHAVPVSVDGTIRLVVRIPKEREGQQQGGGGRGGQQGGSGYRSQSGGGATDSDDIPFAPMPDIG